MTQNMELGFTGAHLDRAATRRTDQAWLSEQLDDPASRFLRFHGDRPLIDVSGPHPQIAWLSRQEAQDNAGPIAPVLLGIDDDGACLFAVQSPAINDDAALRAPHKLIDLRSLATQGMKTAGDLGLLAQARSLLHWQDRHRFCANCGAQTEMAEGGYRRHCKACGADHFPRTDPVVIMVIVRGGKCLLGRGYNFAEGVYSALAGFMEPGETLEDAARRETLEEVGIEIGRVDYIRSQPWPFPSTLMIGLIGEALNEDIVLDRQELEDARWFGVAELRDMLADQHRDGFKMAQPLAIAYHLVIEALKRLDRGSI